MNDTLVDEIRKLARHGEIGEGVLFPHGLIKFRKPSGVLSPTAHRVGGKGWYGVVRGDHGYWLFKVGVPCGGEISRNAK